jgi:hypothetical protein
MSKHSPLKAWTAAQKLAYCEATSTSPELELLTELLTPSPRNVSFHPVP